MLLPKTQILFLDQKADVCVTRRSASQESLTPCSLVMHFFALAESVSSKDFLKLGSQLEVGRRRGPPAARRSSGFP